MADPARPTLTPPLAERLAGIALSCLHREYPNQIAHAMRNDADAGTPRSLHPAFFGCYDWHSAVHGHWCIARLLRTSGCRAAWAPEARAALALSLTPEHLAAELDYLMAEGRNTFERPYGLAWVLALHAELHAWGYAEAQVWERAVAPLADECARRLSAWLAALTHPVRTGVHSQSAFAIGLALDWADLVRERAIDAALGRESRRLYAADRGWSLAFEPSGEDFLSPSLAEAEVMSRLLTPPEFGSWLSGFLPELGEAALASRLVPAQSRDVADGRLAHLDGLSLSRAWMLERIAGSLPAGDPRIAPLLAVAGSHLRDGLARVDGADYARAHWLATFATYALTHRSV